MPSEFLRNTPATETVIAEGISYAYAGDDDRQQKVLVDVDLTLMAGELVVLTGPSGAGKTTLMTLIGALRSIQTGSMKVFGRELAGLNASGKREIRRRVGFIFQDHNLFEALTIFETLSLAMRLRSEPVSATVAREKALALLSQIGMEKYMKAKPGALSTGQRQRLAIARALINDPPLVLADEPTASLDRSATFSVIDLLRQRTMKGTTILMVTHDPQLFDTADRVVTMMDGRIVDTR
jgi:putative ABC transport system ATP-binding protein